MARKAKNPEPITDSVLGQLEWEEDFGWWLTELELAPGHSIEFSIFGRELGAERLAQCRSVFLSIKRREPSLRKAIALDKLTLANQWRDEDEEPEQITLQGFAERIRLTSVLHYEDDTSELFYSDDDIFAGHVILASLDAKGELHHTTIAG